MGKWSGVSQCGVLHTLWCGAAYVFAAWDWNGKPIPYSLEGSRWSGGVVASCSYEARKGFGVHSAMPMRTARQTLPEALIIRRDCIEKYCQINPMTVTENHPARKGYHSLFEKSSIDEFFTLHDGKMDRFFGSACLKLSQQNQSPRCMHQRPDCRFPSDSYPQIKTVSKVATGEAKTE